MRGRGEGKNSYLSLSNFVAISYKLRLKLMTETLNSMHAGLSQMTLGHTDTYRWCHIDTQTLPVPFKDRLKQTYWKGTQSIFIWLNNSRN